MGWYYSLEDRLHFPFVVKCIAERSISPLRVGDEVDVVGMAPEEECEHEMFVLIRWERRTLAVPWPSWRASRWTSRHARRSRIGIIGSLKVTSCEQLTLKEDRLPAGHFLLGSPLSTGERLTACPESTYCNFGPYGRARPARTAVRTAVPGVLLTRKRSQVQTLSRPPLFSQVRGLPAPCRPGTPHPWAAVGPRALLAVEPPALLEPGDPGPRHPNDHPP
jgi:hypothetical protein